MSNYITHGMRDDNQLEPFEVGQVQWIRCPGEGDREALSCGFWHVTPDDAPEPFDLVSHGDETIFLLQGAIRIEPEGGEEFTLTAGCTASFNDGARSRWTILESVVEHFVYS